VVRLRLPATFRVVRRRLVAAPAALVLPDADVFAAVRFTVERFAVDLFAVERLAVDRLAGLRAAGRADVVEPTSSIGHLPVITRSAASATASAINAPRRVALVITELAAWLAVSAASIPASLIALRALGLALIAAAAAASPAASISLLIAAFAILSTVESFDFDFDDPFRVLDFAIANLPFGHAIDT
jgi:hypothetical protein